MGYPADMPVEELRAQVFTAANRKVALAEEEGKERLAAARKRTESWRTRARLAESRVEEARNWYRKGLRTDDWEGVPVDLAYALGINANTGESLD